MAHVADWPKSLVEIAKDRGPLILAAAYLAALVAEVGACLWRRRPWSGGDALPNVASALVGLVVNAAVGVVFGAAYLAIYTQVRLAALPMTWGGLAAAYLMFELVHYVQHRMGHRMGFFWAIHSVHHSSSDLNVPVSARIMWGIALTQPLTMLLPLFGVSLYQYAFLSLATNIWGILNHTRSIPKLGWLEHLVVTPSNHRVHHGTQLKYLDKNYAQTFLLYDKIFGTHQLEEEEPHYGLVEQVEDRNPFMFQTAGFRRLLRQMAAAPRFTDKLVYLVAPPGWSHTGDHRTTEAMRQQPRVDPQALMRVG